MEYVKSFAKSVGLMQEPDSRPTMPTPKPQHVVFGGTSRTAEESVGYSGPPVESMVSDTGVSRVYEDDKSRTLAIDGPGVHGSFFDMFKEKLTGIGPHGVDSMVKKARSFTTTEPDTTEPPVKFTGYSRGAVAGGIAAKERDELGLSTEVDLRDPVAGGYSSITEVGDKVSGRQQLSAGNKLPGFGTSPLAGPRIATVITEEELGGHSARARDKFKDPLPTGTPGKVSIFDGIKERLATREDAVSFRERGEEDRMFGVVDSDSAMMASHPTFGKTTVEDRFNTFADLIEKQNLRGAHTGGKPKSA